MFHNGSYANATAKPLILLHLARVGCRAGHGQACLGAGMGVGEGDFAARSKLDLPALTRAGFCQFHVAFQQHTRLYNNVP
jgi:hypothetical protein